MSQIDGELRFIHAADLHLDSPLRGLSRVDAHWGEMFRQATRKAFKNLINAAIDHRIHFLVIAGDLFDGDWKDFRTGLFFVEQMGQLERAGIPSFVVHGNHDAACQITRRLPWPDSVHVFPADRAETVQPDGIAVAVHGRSYGKRDVKENLAVTYPAAVPGKFNIGILHTAAEGREGHDAYAPCSLDQLLAKEYDYWALGHVHQRELINADPPVLFAGNLQARHVNERGEKGATLVTVRPGHPPVLKALELDVARWLHLRLDASHWHDRTALRPALLAALEEETANHGGRPLAARITITGETDLHGELLAHAEELEEDVAFELAAQPLDIMLERLVVDTVPNKAPSLQGREDVLGKLLVLAAEASADPQVQEDLAKELEQLRQRVPDRTPELPDNDGVAPLLREALDLVRARLNGNG